MPSDPVFLKAQKAIETAIKVSFGGGYSGLDLSAADAVVRGTFSEPQRLPFASIVFIDCVESNDGATLGRYTGSIVFEIYAFCGGDTTIERNDQAMRLGADIINAINADRSLGLSGQTLDTLCSFSTIEGDKFGVQAASCAFIQCTVTFMSDTGV